jgi:single-stranded-DNA-specific exonuclease
MPLSCILELIVQYSIAASCIGLKYSPLFRTMIIFMARAICISHKEDVDGISSAALIKAAFDVGSVILVDYSNMIKVLESVQNNMQNSESNIEHLFLCDLGLSKKNEILFLNVIKKILSLKCRVTYIDHHDLEMETKYELKRAGVKLVHNVAECTSVQIYHKYKKKLDPRAAFIAAAGAITDYMETKPIASVIVSRYDRQFLMLEASALSYMISSSQHEIEYLTTIIDRLSNMKYPHEIEGGFTRAERYAHKVTSVVESLKGSVSVSKNIAYVESNAELSSSMIVNFILGLSGKSVALVYKLKIDINSYIISIRGSKDCKLHLGRVVNTLSSKMGGSGGGHEKACGAVIPKEKIREFIEELDSIITDSKSFT